jgi:hypothetical protein
MRTCDCILLFHLAVAAISLADGQRPDSKLSANQQASGRRKGRTKSAESASKAVTAAVGVGGGVGSGDAVTAAVGVGGGGVGSGAEYLQLTETEWDGKSPWFTGSRKCSLFFLLFYVHQDPTHSGQDL